MAYLILISKKNIISEQENAAATWDLSGSQRCLVELCINSADYVLYKWDDIYVILLTTVNRCYTEYVLAAALFRGEL